MALDASTVKNLHYVQYTFIIRITRNTPQRHTAHTSRNVL